MTTGFLGRGCPIFKQHHKAIFGKVENLTIPVTVLRCDYNKANHMEYLFTIFHRLNTGGNKLTNQEIRNCIYSGDFNELLKRSATNGDFRDLFGLEDDKGYRYAYEEFVLRFYAFVDRFTDYDGNLSPYLNQYMESGRKHFDTADLEAKHDLFERTVDLIFNKITGGAALPKLSKATCEALFVGVARNIGSAESNSKSQLKAMFKELRTAEEFSLENLKNAITTKSKLVARMKRAVDVFSA